jgi:hypothetical protein
LKLPFLREWRASSPARVERKLASLLRGIIFVLCFTFCASAQTITGTVTNGTTNKPAAGDDVILLSLGQGMQEAGRTQTDAKGHFSLKLDDAGPHLIRAVHQGVTYHHMAPPGTTSADVEVYDVAKKVQGVSVTADVMRFQAQANQLQGIRLFAVNNNSNPPRTQMDEPSFEFYLPAGAVIDESMAMTAGGQPISSAAVPQKEKDRYGFIFPLRPGETRFQVAYHLPYNGSAEINPRNIYGAQHFVVMLPKSMQFKGGTGTSFQSMPDPQQPDAMVQLASNITVGQPLDYTISGTGVLTDDSGGGDNQQASASSAAAPESRPGGGLGPPIDAPDPLEKYRWFILGGFAVILAIGAFYITRRSQRVAMADFGASEIAPVEPVSIPKPKPADRTAVLLDALKEELFQLEVEHKQGRISQDEYQKAKAALDQTLERALKRESRASSAAK